jgi:hypothetical protein
VSKGTLKFEAEEIQHPLSTAPGSIMVDQTQHSQQFVADCRRQSCSARQPQIICDQRRIDADLVSSDEH